MLHPFFDLPPRRLLNSPAPVDTDNRSRFVNTFDILLISTELFIAAMFAPLVPGLIKFKRFGREIVQVIVFISFRNKIVERSRLIGLLKLNYYFKSSNLWNHGRIVLFSFIPMIIIHLIGQICSNRLIKMKNNIFKHLRFHFQYSLLRIKICLFSVERFTIDC